MKAKCVIMVEGGIVQDVLIKGKLDYIIIDEDTTESGDCPLCHEEWEVKFEDVRAKTYDKLFPHLPKWLKRLFNLNASKVYQIDTGYLWCPKCKINLDDTDMYEVARKWLNE